MRTNLYKKLKMKLILSIILSAFLVIGIPMIPLGITNHLLYVWVIGIVLTVTGFYGTPLMWVSYASTRVLMPVYETIVQVGIKDIQTLADTLGYKESVVVKHVEKLKKGRYLIGYTITAYPIETKVEKSESAIKCANCGATFRIKGKVGECPFCGVTSQVNEK